MIFLVKLILACIESCSFTFSKNKFRHNSNIIYIFTFLLCGIHYTQCFLLHFFPREMIIPFFFFSSFLIISEVATTHSSSSAHFTNLPRQHVLTVRMDVPEPWNVQATDAVQVQFVLFVPYGSYGLLDC